MMATNFATILGVSNEHWPQYSKPREQRLKGQAIIGLSRIASSEIQRFTHSSQISFYLSIFYYGVIGYLNKLYCDGFLPSSFLRAPNY